MKKNGKKSEKKYRLCIETLLIDLSAPLKDIVYESEFTRIRSYIDLAPPILWFLTRCSRNFDPIFDPIIIAKCSRMVIVEYIGED